MTDRKHMSPYVRRGPGRRAQDKRRIDMNTDGYRCIHCGHDVLVHYWTVVTAGCAISGCACPGFKGPREE